MIAKFIAYFLTSSNAILTDAAESIVNVLASSFAFYSIYLSAQPRDSNHPYGHGKVEFFSVFVEGSLIFLAGAIISVKSAFNLIYPHQITAILNGAVIIGATGIVNFILGYFLIGESTRLKSITLYADGKHLLTDAYSSAGLVVGLILIYFTRLAYLDSLLSIGLGFYIIFNGYKLIRKSVSGLMDESDTDSINEVIKLLNKNRKNSWIDVHNLRAQRYGHELHIDCHVTLPYYFDLNKVHEEVSSVERLTNNEALIQTEFFIHADPCLPECCHYCQMTDCPVRSEPNRKDIIWTLENVTRNHKHFE